MDTTSDSGHAVASSSTRHADRNQSSAREFTFCMRVIVIRRALSYLAVTSKRDTEYMNFSAFIKRHPLRILFIYFRRSARYFTFAALSCPVRVIRVRK